MNNDSKVWLNGNLIPWSEATVPLLSHGFSRGSAIFEVFGVHVGPEGPMAFRMDEHLKRLMRSAELLEMEMAYSTEEIVAAVKTTVAVNHLGRGIVKMLAYWGEEAIIKLVLDSKLDLAIFTIPQSEELTLDKPKPLSACLSKWRKIHPETVPVAAKACSNYFNGYLARKDANNRGFDIGMYVTRTDFWRKAPLSRFLWSKTVFLKHRPWVGFCQASPGCPFFRQCQNRNPRPGRSDHGGRISAADEIFTAHTGIKVEPITRLENREFERPDR